MAAPPDAPFSTNHKDVQNGSSQLKAQSSCPPTSHCPRCVRICTKCQVAPQPTGYRQCVPRQTTEQQQRHSCQQSSCFSAGYQASEHSSNSFCSSAKSLAESATDQPTKGREQFEQRATQRKSSEDLSQSTKEREKFEQRATQSKYSEDLSKSTKERELFEQRATQRTSEDLSQSTKEREQFEQRATQSKYSEDLSKSTKERELFEQRATQRTSEDLSQSTKEREQFEQRAQRKSPEDLSQSIKEREQFEQRTTKRKSSDLSESTKDREQFDLRETQRKSPEDLSQTTKEGEQFEHRATQRKSPEDLSQPTRYPDIQQGRNLSATADVFSRPPLQGISMQEKITEEATLDETTEKTSFLQSQRGSTPSTWQEISKLGLRQGVEDASEAGEEPTLNETIPSHVSSEKELRSTAMQTDLNREEQYEALSTASNKLENSSEDNRQQTEECRRINYRLDTFVNECTPYEPPPLCVPQKPISNTDSKRRPPCQRLLDCLQDCSKKLDVPHPPDPTPPPNTIGEYCPPPGESPSTTEMLSAPTADRLANMNRGSMDNEICSCVKECTCVEECMLSADMLAEGLTEGPPQPATVSEATQEEDNQPVDTSLAELTNPMKSSASYEDKSASVTTKEHSSSFCEPPQSDSLTKKTASSKDQTSNMGCSSKQQSSGSSKLLPSASPGKKSTDCKKPPLSKSDKTGLSSDLTTVKNLLTPENISLCKMLCDQLKQLSSSDKTSRRAQSKQSGNPKSLQSLLCGSRPQILTRRELESLKDIGTGMIKKISRQESLSKRSTQKDVASTKSPYLRQESASKPSTAQAESASKKSTTAHPIEFGDKKRSIKQQPDRPSDFGSASKAPISHLESTSKKSTSAHSIELWNKKVANDQLSEKPSDSGPTLLQSKKPPERESANSQEQYAHRSVEDTRSKTPRVSEISHMQSPPAQNEIPKSVQKVSRSTAEKTTPSAAKMARSLPSKALDGEEKPSRLRREVDESTVLSKKASQQNQYSTESSTGRPKSQEKTTSSQQNQNKTEKSTISTGRPKSQEKEIASQQNQYNTEKSTGSTGRPKSQEKETSQQNQYKAEKSAGNTGRPKSQEEETSSQKKQYETEKSTGSTGRPTSQDKERLPSKTIHDKTEIPKKPIQKSTGEESNNISKESSSKASLLSDKTSLTASGKPNQIEGTSNVPLSYCLQAFYVPLYQCAYCQQITQYPVSCQFGMTTCVSPCDTCQCRPWPCSIPLCPDNLSSPFCPRSNYQDNQMSDKFSQSNHFKPVEPCPITEIKNVCPQSGDIETCRSRPSCSTDSGPSTCGAPGHQYDVQSKNGESNDVGGVNRDLKEKRQSLDSDLSALHSVPEHIPSQGKYKDRSIGDELSYTSEISATQKMKKQDKSPREGKEKNRDNKTRKLEEGSQRENGGKQMTGVGGEKSRREGVVKKGTKERDSVRAGSDKRTKFRRIKSDDKSEDDSPKGPMIRGLRSPRSPHPSSIKSGYRYSESSGPSTSERRTMKLQDMESSQTERHGETRLIRTTERDDRRKSGRSIFERTAPRYTGSHGIARPTQYQVTPSIPSSLSKTKAPKQSYKGPTRVDTVIKNPHCTLPSELSSERRAGVPRWSSSILQDHWYQKHNPRCSQAGSSLARSSDGTSQKSIKETRGGQIKTKPNSNSTPPQLLDVASLRTGSSRKCGCPDRKNFYSPCHLPTTSAPHRTVSLPKRRKVKKILHQINHEIHASSKILKRKHFNRHPEVDNLPSSRSSSAAAAGTFHSDNQFCDSQMDSQCSSSEWIDSTSEHYNCCAPEVWAKAPCCPLHSHLVCGGESCQTSRRSRRTKSKPVPLCSKRTRRIMIGKCHLIAQTTLK